MRRFLFYAIPALSCLFVIALGVSFWLQNDLARSVRESIGPAKGRGSLRAFCFTAVLPSPLADPYYAQLEKSVKAAADLEDAAVRFMEYRPGGAALDAPSDPSALARLVSSCAYMDLDGLIVSVPDSPELRASIDACDAAGIPVVTLNYDSPESRRKCYVGNNDFQVGYSGGDIVAKLHPRGGRVVLVLPDDSLSSSSGRDSLRQGFMTALSNARGIALLDTIVAQNTALAGEGVARDILLARSDADTVFFTTAQDTIGAAQAIIDMNQVGKVSIVGLSDTPEGRLFVKNGVVTAALSRDPEKAGKDCVMALMSLAKEGHASAFIDTGLSVISADPRLSFFPKVTAP